MSAVLFVREALLKATHKELKWIQAYTDKHGRVHGMHQKHVLVADDHDNTKVATGQGSFYQKIAHKNAMADIPNFQSLDIDHQANIILHHATGLQSAASSAAAVSQFKASMLAGKVPLPAQYLAMKNAPANMQGKVVDACVAAIGAEKYEQLLFAASAKANQTKGKTSESKTAQAVKTGQNEQTPAATAASGAPAVEPAKPAKVAEPVSPVEAAVADDSITVPSVSGKTGPTTFKPAPDFADYAEAQAWILARAKAMGMSKSEFQSSHEFSHAYPKIKAAYAVVKQQYDKKNAETGASLLAEMKDAGVKLGDTVAFSMTGAFLSVTHYEGKVVMHGGIPHVKLAHEVAVTKPGGKIGYTTFLKWAPHMKVKVAPVPEAAKAAAGVPDAQIKIKHTSDGFPIKPNPPAFGSTITDLENWIEDGNAEQLKDAVVNLTGLTSESAKTALAYAEAGVRYLGKKADAKEKFKASQVASGPKEGDTKPGADGSNLVFKDGRWHKYVDADESGEVPPVLVPVDDDSANHKAAVAAMENGAFYQKEAIKKLKAEHGPAWAAMPPSKQHELAHAKYQALQGAASQAAAVSGWKKHMLAGQVPTPSEVKAMSAFDTATPDKAVKVMNEVQAVIGLDKYVQLVTQAHAKAAKAPAAATVKVFVTAPQPTPAVAAAQSQADLSSAALVGIPAYDHLAAAESAGGVHQVMGESKKWLAANHGKEAELNQAVFDLGYSNLKVPVPGAPPVNEAKLKFKGNDKVSDFISMFDMHGGTTVRGLSVDQLLEPKMIEAFNKLTPEEKMDVAAAISFYGPHKLKLFQEWLGAQNAKAAAPAAPTGPVPVTSNVYTNKSPGHNKFWSVSVHGTQMKTSYGKLGTQGSVTTKEFASPEAAVVAANKLKSEKVAKGYQYGYTGVHQYDGAAPVASVEASPADPMAQVKAEFDKIASNGDFDTLQAIMNVGGLKPEVKDYLAGLIAAGIPKDGDTKQGADGTLVFKDGRWHKQGIVVPDFSDDASMWNGIYTKAANELKAAFESGGAAAVKKLITVHKTGNKAGKFSCKFPYGKFTVGPTDGVPRRKKMYAFIQAMLDSKQDAGKKAVFTTATPAAAAKPAAPKAAKPTASAPTVKVVAGKPPVTVIDAWTQTGPQKGSNPGGKFKDKNGQEWYCKFPADTDVAMNELLAANFYQMLGVAVPNLKLVEKGGKIGIASKWVDGISKGTSAQLAKAPGAHQAFALDAWLANWDVVGLSNDNLMLGKDGAAVRVDVGGSLDYRAMGNKKGSAFGDTVPELETLLDAKTNDKSASVFGGIKKGDMAWGLGQLNKMKPSQIKELCQKAGPGSDADKAALAKKLIARREFILAKMGVRDQWAHIKALDPTKLPVNPADLPKPIDFANLNGPGKGLSSKAHVNAQNTLDSANMIAFAANGNLTALKNYLYDAVDKETGASLGKKSIIDHPSSQIKNQWAGLVETLQSISTPPLETLKMPSLGAAGSEEEMSQLAGTFNPLDRVETVAAEHRMGFFMAVSQIDDVQDLVGGYKWHYLTSASKFVKDAKAGFSKLGSAVKAYISGVQSSGWINHVWSQGKPTVDASGNGGSYSGGVQTLSSKIYADALEIPEGTTLTRGMTDKTAGKSMTQQLLNSTPGLVIQNTDSMCTSYKEGWGWGGDVVLTIRCGKGCKGTPSFASGHFGSEQEITTLPGQRFVVLSVKKSGSSAHVELFMLPPHESYVEELGKLQALGKAIVVFFKRMM